MSLVWIWSVAILCRLYSTSIAETKVSIAINFEGSDVVYKQQCECVLFFQCDDGDNENLLPVAYNNKSVHANVNCGEFEVCCKQKYFNETRLANDTAPVFGNNVLFPQKNKASEACSCVSPVRCLMDPTAKISGAGMLDVRVQPCSTQEICCPPEKIIKSDSTVTKPPPPAYSLIPEIPKQEPDYMPLNTNHKDIINKANLLREENALLKEKLQKFERRKEGRICEWMYSSDGTLPAGALYIGQDSKGDTVYAGRAFHDSDLIPAQISPRNKVAYIGYGGVQYKKSEYEVLCNCNEAKWMAINKTEIPPAAIIFGYSYQKDKTYLGRTEYQGKKVFVKIQPYHKVAYILLDGKEYYLNEDYKFETLVLN